MQRTSTLSIFRRRDGGLFSLGIYSVASPNWYTTGMAETYDLIVVGGGLLGTAIARDAALRGLSVSLFEAGDFGAGAVSRGSRLVLGGLSALGTLDFTQVRDDIKEREILLQMLPHLVRPQTCLVPFYKDSLLAQARLRAGLALADALGFDHALRVHQLLTGKAAQKRAPCLRSGGLLGAALVWEAAIPDVTRLARELAFDARRCGAVLHPQTSVEALIREPGRGGCERVSGVRWKDRLSGNTGHAEASLVIVAAGSGAAALLEQPAGSLTKTVSVVHAPLPELSDALVFPQENAPTLLFALPSETGCRAGSITTEYRIGDPAYATGAEVQSLTHALQSYVPDFEFAGVMQAEAAVYAQIVPGEEVRDAGSGGGTCDGLLSASGAGLTRFRRVAEDAVDLACRKLGRALSVPPCRTATTPLPEPSGADDDCLTLRDFLERRLPREWTAEQRHTEMPAALETLAAKFGWDSARQSVELKAWDAETALRQTFRVL